MSGTVEAHVQILGKVPTYREFSVPQELFAERKRQFAVLRALHVAFLQFVVVTQYLRVERQVLWKPVETESFEDVKPLALAFDFLERFKSFVNRRIAVVHGASPVVLVLIYGGLSACMAMTVAVAEREVCRVVRHRMFLRRNTHFHVRQREVGVLRLCHGDAFYRVAFMLLHSFEGIVKFHVRVERVVFRTGLLLCYRVIKRDRHFCLVGEELSELEVRCHTICLVVILCTLCHTVFKTSEAFGNIFSCYVYATDVRQLHIEVTLCRPAAGVVIFLQSEFVHPHFSRLLFCGKVSHTYNHSAHLAESRITYDSDFVVRFLFVVCAVWVVV